VLHSGGGNISNTELNNAAVPVLWMGNEAIVAGLKLSRSRVEWDWGKLSETGPKESLSWVWRFFEVLPFKRLSYVDSKRVTWCVASAGLEFAVNRDLQVAPCSQRSCDQARPEDPCFCRIHRRL
jgi:hypothetical protein